MPAPSPMQQNTDDALSPSASQPLSETEVVLAHEKRSPEPPDESQFTARRFCEQCAAINFSSFFAGKGNQLSLEPRSSWKCWECDFCEFVSLSISEDLPDTIRLLYGKDVARPAKPMGVTGRAFDSDFFDARSSYYILRGRRHWYLLLHTPFNLSSKLNITPPMIDFNLVKGWLQKSAINGTCTTDQHGSRNSFLVDPAASNDIALRVIDCTSRSLLQLPPHAQYVTLSYIWGSQSERHDPGAMPADLPATIEDSIVVCLGLGYNYLWVDRYCIPQGDSEERRRQIQRMDMIFQNSILTIIACTGRDPQYGLPGVRKARQQYPSIFFEGTGYLQRMPGDRDIQTSAWSERGWTYQEALLSQTRLYFTDSQLYFECRDSVECECASLAGLGTSITEDHHWIFSQNTWLKKPINIYDCIEELSRRSLSFSSDTLNALLGIFAAYDREFKVRHLCGMPFMQGQSTHATYDKKSLPTLSKSLFFSTETDSIRCHEFPSWSWAGWTGIIGWNDRLESINTANFEPCVAVELASDLVISWEEYQSTYDILNQHSGGAIEFIYLQAYLSPILGARKVGHLRFFDMFLSNELCLRVPDCGLEDGLFNRIHVDGVEQLSVLRLQTESNYSRADKAAHLLMRNMGTHWERITATIGWYKDRNGDDLDPEFWPSTLQTVRLG